MNEHERLSPDHALGTCAHDDAQKGWRLIMADRVDGIDRSARRAQEASDRRGGWTMPSELDFLPEEAHAIVEPSIETILREDRESGARSRRLVRAERLRRLGLSRFF